MFRRNLEKAEVYMLQPPCLELVINGQLESLALLHLQRRRQGLKIQGPQWRPLSSVAFLQRYVFLAHPHSTSCFFSSGNKSISLIYV